MKPKQQNNIKTFLKPRQGRVQQGYFRPANKEKYIGDPTQIIFRSSWEFKFLKWCDSSPSVIKYSSEPIAIPYYSPLDKRGHLYYVDFYVEVIDNQGKLTKWIIEVKPLKYTKQPTAPKRMTDKQTASYMYAAKQYIINQAKFQAAREFAKGRGIQFGIITENFLFNSI